MNKRKKIAIPLTLGLLVIGYVLATKIYRSEKEQASLAQAQADNSLFVPDYAATMGPEDAEVTLVEFLDPECESCRRFYPYVKELMKRHDGKIRLVVRYAPFHGNSEFAIRILEAARFQGKYWETLEALFREQPRWGSHHDPKPDLIWALLPALGLNVERVKKEMNSQQIDRIIKEDIAAGQKLQVKATPSFFINGKPLQEFGYRQLEEAVEAEL